MQLHLPLYSIRVRKSFNEQLLAISNQHANSVKPSKVYGTKHTLEKLSNSKTMNVDIYIHINNKLHIINSKQLFAKSILHYLAKYNQTTEQGHLRQSTMWYM